MISKEKLKEYAGKLMFDMNDNEYETLQQEFEVILKQMDLISKIEGIEKVEPMTFPYVFYHSSWHSDIITGEISTEDVLKNTKNVENNQVKVPKVVE